MRHKTVSLRLLVGVLIALTMAGVLACGGDEEEEAPAAPPAAAPAPAAPAPAAPAPAAPAPAAPAPAAAIVGTGTKKGYQPPKQEPGKVPLIALYDGPRPTTWQENPRFTEMVKNQTEWTVNSHQGPLLPFEERIPIEEDRLVYDVVDEIGEYGGFMHRPAAGYLMHQAELAPAYGVALAADYTTLIPVAFKAFNISDDGRTFTFTLRRGLRWSDAAPFTMEDVKLALVLMDDPEKNSTFPWTDPITRNKPAINYVDDLNFSFTFDSPNFTFLTIGTPSSFCRGPCIYAPQILKKWMPQYADPAELKKVMDDEGVEDWVSLLSSKISVHNLTRVDIPHIGYLIQAEGDCCGASQTYVANPYSFFFDPEGNQLPYIDGYTFTMFESRDVVTFRGMAGEDDFNNYAYALPEIPLYQANMERGDYSIYHWVSHHGADTGFTFNQTFNEDPEIGRLMRQQEFRQAISYAIDRDSLNDAIFMGVGTPQNWAAHSSHPYYPGEAVAKLGIEYDPDKANQMLDDLGLIDTDGDGMRNRIGDLTGNTGNLVLFMEVTAGDETHVADRALGMMALAEEYLADVGVELNWKQTLRSRVALRANKLYMGLSGLIVGRGAWGGALPWWEPYGTDYYPGATSHLGPLMGQYVQTYGEKGMAPTGPDPAYLPLAPEGTYPADSNGSFKQIQDLWLEGREHARLSPERIAIAKEMYTIAAEQKHQVNFVAFSGWLAGVVLKRNNVRNVKKDNLITQYGHRLQIVYFEDGIDNLNNPGNKSKKYKSESFLTGLTYD